MTLMKLKASLESRQRIGVATGILVERYELTPDAAFRFLVGVSNATNIEVRDVATAVISDTVGRKPHD